jgi:hypothetical protein
MTHRLDMHTPLDQQEIHDEFNGSVGMSEDAEVYKQLPIVKWSHKKRMLEEVVNKGKFEGKTFVSARVKGEVTERQMNIILMTKDGAALRLSLTKYHGGKAYLGTSGSPVKILTGQNVVEVSESRKIEKLARKLDCSLFESTSLLGFMLLRKFIREVLGEQFFTDREMQDIRDRKISVMSVGYAIYLEFGDQRDSHLDMLGTLAEATVVFYGRNVPLVEFMGMTAKAWTGPEDEDWIGPKTGVMFQKKLKNQIAFKQLFYLKEAEVKDKQKSSGRNNNETVEFLVGENKEAFHNTLVRVDNTFGTVGIKEWMYATKARERNDIGGIPLWEAAKLFAEPTTRQSMINYMGVELGIRTLLMAPSEDKIKKLIESDNSPLQENEREWLEIWRATMPTYEKKGNKSRIVYKSLLGDSKLAAKLALKLWDEYYLDVRLPYIFYAYLTEVKGNMFLTMEDRLAISHYARGYDGSNSLADQAPRIKKLMRKKVSESISGMRVSLDRYKNLPFNRARAAKTLKDYSHG